MTSFIEVHVRTALIVHGFTADNVAVEEAVNETAYVRKLIAVSRIQSVSEQYLLVEGMAGRQMFWEYQESMDEVVDRLTRAGAVV